LITALKDTDTEVRMNAVKALGEIGDKRALEFLKEALKTEIPQRKKVLEEVIDKLHIKAGGQNVELQKAKESAGQLPSANPLPEASPQAVPVQPRQEQPQPQGTASTERITGKEGAEMVLIPAGEFQMGSDDSQFLYEKPVHTVYVDAFYIDIYEVTNAQYKKFMDATGHRAPEYWNDPPQWEDTLKDWNDPKSNLNHPVVGVSWHDAMAYAQWAGKRLPTEAEWEKAARGGLVGRKYPWGDTLSHDEANYRYTGGRDQWEGPAPVGSFPPNVYGLYYILGNVWEWCLDQYDHGFYANSPPNNPVAGEPIRDKFINISTNRVVRGGSFIDTDFLYVAKRMGPRASHTALAIGFRCAKSVSP
jgi:formylglycine-generating enzyme required for sulfatase activity